MNGRMLGRLRWGRMCSGICCTNAAADAYVEKRRRKRLEQREWKRMLDVQDTINRDLRWR